MATISTAVPEDLSALSDEDLHALWYQVSDDLGAARADQKRVTEAIRSRNWEPGDPPAPSEAASGEPQAVEAVGVESEAAATGSEG